MVIKLVTWFSLVIDHGSAVWHFLSISHVICLAFKVLYCCLCCAFVLCTHFSARSFTAVVCPAKYLPPLILYSLSSLLHYKKKITNNIIFSVFYLFFSADHLFCFNVILNLKWTLVSHNSLQFCVPLFLSTRDPTWWGNLLTMVRARVMAALDTAAP